jgi:hypothetical protein
VSPHEILGYDEIPPKLVVIDTSAIVAIMTNEDGAESTRERNRPGNRSTDVDRLSTRGRDRSRKPYGESPVIGEV